MNERKKLKKENVRVQSAVLDRTTDVSKHSLGISKHKSFTDKRKRARAKQTQFNDSITGVNPIRTHGFGVYKGKRVAWAVRVDEKLLKKAKPVLRAKFGSTCRGVEAWLAGLVATYKGDYELGVNPSNTVSIGKLVIERNLRSRRKLTVEEEVEVSSVCGHANCSADVVGTGLWRNKLTLPLCEVHFAEAKKLFWEWSELKLLEASP